MSNKLAVTGLNDPIAQTLFIPLYMKSCQSKLKDAFFSDPWACALMEQFDYDFSSFDQSVLSSVGVAIRAGYFDRLTADIIAAAQSCVVVNLGAGLDARFQRIQKLIGNTMEDKAWFYNLDLPEVIALREQLLPADSCETCISASVFDGDWMDELNARHQSATFVFIAEGLLMYFDNCQVQQLLQELANRFPGCHILFDGISRWMRDNSDNHDSVKYAGAGFKLAFDSPREIEQWHGKLKVISVAHYADFKEWKRVGFFNYLLSKYIPKYFHSSFLVHACVEQP
ncbi:class I SAM-dependent methyltransferase [Shewanella algae]|uniref:class I SAM-dependent methyltransferase n=1 Tax=Shewanella algae TaxID=38313 RepID=UPI0012FF34F5|nr:class I SAM-dependent methyltransferase [Shewanella algae]MBO2641172.1 class I SAM-dependent methyltransferase [Shewanella algae]